jgi:hypothetical protein
MFSEFNEQLFYLVKQKKYQKIINKLDLKRELLVSGIASGPNGEYHEKEAIKDKITDYFDRVLERKEEVLYSLNDKAEKERDSMSSRKNEKSSKANLLYDLEDII